ncbi:MAG: DUF427 domain-containing protein [Myxococcales bacterium]|nr:DUF427 domain-containing protein [Myxococcales bacterium]
MSLPGWARAGRAQWRFTGDERPEFAEPPGPGQRSVWDFPRPPTLEAVPAVVEVRFGEHRIARSERALRVLETGGPPTCYLPPDDVDRSVLEATPQRSRCEWKGEARYFDLVLDGARHEAVGWSYPEPFAEFEALRDFLSFYPARVACFVDGVRVAPQPGGFYGGWVTPEFVGPFKGEPGVGGI